MSLPLEALGIRNVGSKCLAELPRPRYPSLSLVYHKKLLFKLFPQIHIERWAFDVELLYLAERFNIPIAEIAVEWHEVAGSKITPILSWIQMGRDIVLIWFRYTVQLWKDNDLKL